MWETCYSDQDGGVLIYAYLTMDDKDWKKELTPEQYRVMRERGTEPAFTGKYYNEHAEGAYKCAACGAELFSSGAKFDSGTGWPSFTEPANLGHIELRKDTSYGMDRTEVVCKNCGAHLGHVFDDGPADKGGKRYCINSVCLDLEREQEAEKENGNGDMKNK
jgi:peptide-methionine (R)-S-oxide reductase